MGDSRSSWWYKSRDRFHRVMDDLRLSVLLALLGLAAAGVLVVVLAGCCTLVRHLF